MVSNMYFDNSLNVVVSSVTSSASKAMSCTFNGNNTDLKHTSETFSESNQSKAS